jgi:hypothetical protein
MITQIGHQRGPLVASVMSPVPVVVPNAPVPLLEQAARWHWLAWR